MEDKAPDPGWRDIARIIYFSRTTIVLIAVTYLLPMKIAIPERNSFFTAPPGMPGSLLPVSGGEAGNRRFVDRQGNAGG
jgi:hypothetical protein